MNHGKIKFKKILADLKTLFSTFRSNLLYRNFEFPSKCRKRKLFNLGSIQFRPKVEKSIFNSNPQKRIRSLVQIRCCDLAPNQLRIFSLKWEITFLEENNP